MNLMEVLIIRKLQHGGAADVTPAAVVAATGKMTDQQRAAARENLGAGTVNPSDVVDVISASPSIEPEENTVYHCGTLTSLTVSNPPSAGAYTLVFTSGSTPTQTTFPATVLGLEDFAAEANTLYEINVLDNRAVVGSWKVSST